MAATASSGGNWSETERDASGRATLERRPWLGAQPGGPAAETTHVYDPDATLWPDRPRESVERIAGETVSRVWNEYAAGTGAVVHTRIRAATQRWPGKRS